MKKKIYILDSTLRDGAQSEGISFSVRDKLNIVAALDTLGADYIEAGNPSSNPKDSEFFFRMKNVKLKNAKLTAFGSTRRKNISAEEDKNLQSLVEAGTEAVTVFGKSWDFHVTEILRASLGENIQMIKDTVAFLKRCGKEVIFDAEHFFDGYKRNPEYALDAIRAACAAGADSICLCDTNGGCFPDEVSLIVKSALSAVDVPIGIHTHDDGGMAVADSVCAVESGATQVQGTLIGFGERCGNANLSAIIPALQIKRDYACIPPSQIEQLTFCCRTVAEISNVRLNKNMPYVGKNAFTHKAGMHIDGVTKAPESFEHIPPESVGNTRRFLMSEVAGRSTILEKIRRIDPALTKEDPRVEEIVDKVKQMEFLGYQFEGADASFDLLIRRVLGDYTPYFDIEKFKTIGEQIKGVELSCATALVKVRVGEEEEISAAEGDGPVNALDIALRKALLRFFPTLSDFELIDYKVRILDSRDTGSTTRVLIESSDKNDTWTTVGVSKDIIDASLIALVDAIEYKLIKDEKI